MKFLADENFPRQAVRALREQGFDLGSVAEEAAGLIDEDVLARSVENRRTLLTLDKDFGELVFHRGLPADCGVILFRIDAESPAQFVELVLSVLQSKRDWIGFFTVVSGDRIRMRPLPKA